MRRGRILIFLALIIILALAAFFVFQNFLLPGMTNSGGEEIPGEIGPTPAVIMTEIIVVTQNVERGTVLTEEYLGTIEFPQDSVIPGMFMADQIPAVVGRNVKLDVDSGMPLTSGMLIDVDETLSDAGSIAALSIPKGKVAIPIPVDRLSSVAYALRPGDHVSVIGSFVVLDVDTEFQSALPNTSASIISTGRAGEDQPSYLTVQIVPGGEGSMLGRTELDPLLNELVYVMPSEPQRARLVTQILMQDAVVLRFGAFSFEDLLPEEDVVAAAPPVDAEDDQGAAVDQTQGVDEQEPQPEQEPPDIVTLIVTPQEAVALEYLMKRDVEFTLVLRASGDVDPIDTEAATFQYMLETYNIPVPAKLPYDLDPRYSPTLPEEAVDTTAP